MNFAIGAAELAILTLLALFGWLGTQFPFLRPVLVLGMAMVLVIGMLRFSESAVEPEESHPTLNLSPSSP